MYYILFSQWHLDRAHLRSGRAAARLAPAHLSAHLSPHSEALVKPSRQQAPSEPLPLKLALEEEGLEAHLDNKIVRGSSNWVLKNRLYLMFPYVGIYEDCTMQPFVLPCFVLVPVCVFFYICHEVTIIIAFIFCAFYSCIITRVYMANMIRWYNFTRLAKYLLWICARLLHIYF